MIISKDLFIFGEHIFGTIIPENTTTTPAPPPAVTIGISQLQQQQQQQQQQQHNYLRNNTNNFSKPILSLTSSLSSDDRNKQPTKTAATTPTVAQTLIKQETLTATTPSTKKDIEKVTNEIESKEKNRKFKQLYNTPSSSALARSTTKQHILLPYSISADTTPMEADFYGTLLNSNAEVSPSVKRNLVKKLADPTSNSTNNKPNDFVQTEGSYAHTLRSRQGEKSKLILLRETLQAQLLQHDVKLNEDHLNLNSPIPQQQAHLKDQNIVSSERVKPSNKHNHRCSMNNVISENNSRNGTVTVAIPFIEEPQRTLQLSFQNVTLLQNDRKILDDICGMVSPGEVLAIMGPSGSGKTTLLDCLSGQRRIDSGSICVNRELLSKKWRRKICYVLQEEIFFPNLTLRETVMYSALLRLPENIPKSDKVKLVDSILQSLELTFCQHTKFGDYMNRGLSGGEKKRANIACELLTNPLLMLLDEPTSGLDSHSAISLMKILKRYAAHEQKTVVITVHQPSSQMFHMFDKLLLLYNGCTAYFGEVNNIYRYFEDIGVVLKPHYNPAEFVLEQLKSNPDIREKLFVAAKESHGNFLNRNCITQSGFLNGHMVTATATKNSNSRLNVGDKICKQDDVLINDILSSYYKDMRKSHNQNVMLADSHHQLDIDQHHDESCSCEEATQQLWYGGDSKSSFNTTSSDTRNDGWLDYPTRFATQFSVLSSRNFKEAKSRMLSKLNWFQTVGLALMAGAIWYNIPRTEEYLHDLQGWMFFSQTYWMLFALFGALNSFPSEREVINKERRSGSYRLSAYYLAKMFGELPLVVTLPTVYLMISYPMLGCSSLKLFFLMLIFLLLNTIVAQSVGFFIGACCMDMNVSITISALYTLATQLFGGYLSTRIPNFLSWIRYTSMIHYAYQNMQILEFSGGPPIECSRPSSYEVCKNNNTNFIPYEDILKAQNSSSPLWLNTLVLTMFFLVFRVLGYAVLRYIRCPKS